MGFGSSLEGEVRKRGRISYMEEHCRPDSVMRNTLLVISYSHKSHIIRTLRVLGCVFSFFIG